MTTDRSDASLTDPVERFNHLETTSVNDPLSAFIGEAVVSFTEAAEVVETLATQREALLAALKELVTLVRGECPSLLNEDSGGDARLSLAIDAAIAKAEGRA